MPAPDLPHSRGYRTVAHTTTTSSHRKYDPTTIHAYAWFQGQSLYRHPMLLPTAPS